MTDSFDTLRVATRAHLHALILEVRIEHQEQDLDSCDDAIPVCTACDEDWPCLPARLADALEAAEQRIKDWEQLAAEKNWAYVHDQQNDFVPW